MVKRKKRMAANVLHYFRQPFETKHHKNNIEIIFINAFIVSSAAIECL